MMESFQQFIETFKNHVDAQNGTDLSAFLKDSRRYFQNIPTDSTGLILSELFDEKTGVLNFLNRELNRFTAHKDFDTAIAETFHLIEFVLIQFHHFLEEKYTLAIKNICQFVLKAQCSQLIKKSAAQTLKVLIEVCVNVPHLNQTIKEFIQFFIKLKLKERSLVLSVLSTIAKYHPELPELEKYSERIFQMLHNDFKLQMREQATVAAQNRGPLVEIKIYLNAYKDLLDKYQPPPKVRSRYYKELYDWIKSLAEATYTRAKDTLREAIDLLSRRIQFFEDFVYRDYQYWHTILLNMSKEPNIVNAECGQHALKVFYKTSSNKMFKNNTDIDNEIFLFFKTTLEKQLADKTLDLKMLGLTLYGLSQLAAPSKHYLSPSYMNTMYMLIARSTFPLCFREDIDEKYTGNLCSSQEALSEIILHMPEISFDEISVLIKLTVHIIKTFPHFPATSQANAVYTLVKTIVNVSHLPASIFDEFIYNMIHDGIIWSSSHTLLIDAELQQERQKTKEQPLTYKNYLHLWVELLKPDRYYRSAHITQQIYDTMIDVYINLINKLDLSTKTKENSILSDVALSMAAVNEADFRIFLNLSDLYVDIINSYEPHFLQNTQNKLLYEIARMSYKNPLISSFYKIMRTILNSLEAVYPFDEYEYEPGIFNLVSKYLSNTLDIICSFSNELLTSCLFLILDAPITFMKDMFIRTIPVFKIAFTMGLTEFDLAYTALNTLEKWTNHIEKHEMKNFLHEIVPTLEPYLQSEETAAEMLQDIFKTERKVIKRVILMDSEKTLENFQRRILLFLGSLDSDIVSNYVYKRALHTGASWDKKDLVKYSIPFPDCTVDIHFDKILPRLIFLSENSGDRRTKLNACEMLHAIILFIFGKTSQLLQSDPERFVSVYGVLCPALLNLGCDSDDTARQIFQPLALQTTHWLSSKFMLESTATGCFIESIFNGLCSTSNSALREFSGMCLAEFIRWSIKQCTDRDSKNTHFNVHAVIRRFTSFALHPATSKRIAAAVGFNHIYRILRENDVIISHHWLELLFCFVKSLEGCNDPSIHNAISHIEKVLLIKKDMLNIQDKRRKKPPEFEEATFKEAVVWLLKQSRSLDQSCRRKSMELHVNLSKENFDNESQKTMVEKLVDAQGMEGLNNIILKNVHSKMECSSTKAMSYLLRSLDCYIWLISEKLIDVKCLFTEFNPQKDVIFDCISNFIHTLSENKMEIAEVEISKESEELQTLRCKTIMFILEFTEALLNLKEAYITIVLLNKSLLKLISACVMTPKAIGIDTKNLDQTEALPRLLEGLLHIIKDVADETLLQSLSNELTHYVNKHVTNLFELREMATTNAVIDTKDYLTGLLLLRRYNLLSSLYAEEREVIESINKIFVLSIRQEDGKFYRRNHTLAAKEHIQKLMQLLLTNYSESVTKTLLEIIKDDNLLDDTKHVQTVGEHFLWSYKDIIFQYMLKNIEKSMNLIIEMYKDVEPTLLSFVEKLLLYVQRHQKENIEMQCMETLANVLLKNFATFEFAVNNVNRRKEQLINIYGIAVRLKQKPIDAVTLSQNLWTWFARQITEGDDIEYKTQILRNFLICMLDTTFCHSSLPIVLRNLKYSIFTLPQGNAETTNNTYALKAINCYNTILMLLPVTKSVVLFELAVYFATGIFEHVCNERTNDYLRSYFNSISSDYVVKSLEVVYKLFADSSTKNNEKLDILKHFLVPIFGYSKTFEVEEFFKRNIAELCKVIGRNLVGAAEDVERLIISQIASYELIAIMFATVNLSNIENNEEEVMQNVDISSEKNLLEYITTAAFKVRSLKTIYPEHKEIMRQLHCSAFNCCIAFTTLKDDEQSYTSLFAEEKIKNNLIWKKILDCQKKYEFKQTLDEYPKYRRKLINIRKKMQNNHDKIGLHQSYIHKYDLASSTLTNDLNLYDFHDATVLPKSNDTTQKENMSLTFECDDLNEHECMAPICGLLTHMIYNEISVPPDTDVMIMPAWLKNFHAAMFSDEHNVTLLLLKVILNVQAIFKPYAKFFLRPIIKATLDHLALNYFDYIVSDALVVLMDWHTIAIPSEPEDKRCAQNLIELLINKVLTDKSQTMYKGIYKYNLEIITTLIGTWKSFLTIPSSLEVHMDSSPEAAVHLILIYLTNDMQKQIIQKDKVLDFLLTSLETWKDSEATALHSCEAIGLIFKFLENDNEFQGKKDAVIENVKTTFRQIQTVSANKLTKCILAFCKNFPQATADFFHFASANLVKADAVCKANCLELFLLHIPQVTEEEIVKLLGYMRFSTYLENKNALCEGVSLKIINNLVTVLSASNLLPLAKLVRPYTSHKLAEYREIAYDIFMQIHKKYSEDISHDEIRTKLTRLSCEMLMAGLLDPNDTLQEKVLNFWSKDAELKTKSKDRLLEVLKCYSPATANVFLPFLPLLMFDLTTKHEDFNKPMFEALYANFKDYKIAISWRRRNLKSMTPLFASSLASEINQSFTQISNLTHDHSFDYSINSDNELLATQDLQFAATFVDDDELTPISSSVTEIHEDDKVFKEPKIPEPAYNKRSKRFLRSSTTTSYVMRQKEISKNIQRSNMIKDEVVRQRSSIKLCRKYRIGDFPDIEISHFAIITPLQELVKKDNVICKDVMVSLFCSLVKKVKNEETGDQFFADVADILDDILRNCEGNNPVIAATLEIMLNLRFANCDPNIVMKVAKTNGLTSLGILLLEENLIHGKSKLEPEPKKSRNEGTINHYANEWIQLASLYESINEVDIVLSIFCRQECSENMQQASIARAAGRWVVAKKAYERAFEEETEVIKEHSLQGLLECLKNMSNWDDIDDNIEKKLHNNFDNIWENEWKDWMFPWLFHLHTFRLCLNDLKESFNGFKNALPTWLCDRNKLKYLERLFGEELAIFTLNSNEEKAKSFLMKNIDDIRDVWIRTNPLSTQLRVQILAKLRRINDINMYLKSIKTADKISGLQDLAKFWKKSGPLPQDDIFTWEKVMSYRVYFLSLIEKEIKPLQTDITETPEEDDEETTTFKSLRLASFELTMKIIDLALHHRNKLVTKKHLTRVEEGVHQYPPVIYEKFMLNAAQFAFLAGETNKNIQKKISKYSTSIMYCHQLLNMPGLSTSMKVASRKCLSITTLTLAKLISENNEFVNVLTQDHTILESINPNSDNIEDIKDALQSYTIRNLKECCEIADTREIAACYFALSKYCYERLIILSNNTSLTREFVTSTLKAMSYSSLDAAHYFPCLLKEEYLLDEQTRADFANISAIIPTWLFLSWQAQLFSHLGTSITPILVPIIEKIVEMYPNAVIYTFRLTVETNPSLLNDERIYKIRRILYDRPEVEKFLSAMQYVVQPELYLVHYLMEFLKNLPQGRATALDNLLKKVFKSELDATNDPKPGYIYHEIFKFQQKVKNIELKKEKDVEPYVLLLRKEILENLARRRNRSRLKDYSVFLDEYTGENLEIPGQYTGNQKPLPQYHAKIIKIEPMVKIMQSLRKPIRITMVGNDAKNYNFLVKFGEDLRLDQRIQQLFATMNKTLSNDVTCSDRRLSIDTYQVIPLSRSLGLIQWVNNTKSLRDLINFTLPANEIQRYSSLSNDYANWIRMAAPHKKLSEQHKEAASKYDAAKTIEKMTELIAKTDRNALRNTFLMLAPSPESFVSLRHNFITSYATLCVAHWILGIGDRHLDNTLVEVESGKSLGIDFGLAFGAGVDQTVPELMPFRLTSQILGLLKPFTEKDLFGATMIHALTVLRNDKGPIIACMDVFLHEPLNWTEHMNKSLKEKEETISIKWQPKMKIDLVIKKLQGIKPSLVTIQQLKENHNDQYFERYKAIINGEENPNNERHKMKDEGLSPEEQVKCLLEQATDLNILGRTYVGWKPWF